MIVTSAIEYPCKGVIIYKSRSHAQLSLSFLLWDNRNLALIMYLSF